MQERLPTDKERSEGGLKMFDICAICANQNDKGKCIKPGETCDEAYDFRLKPVYQAAPEMLEALRTTEMYLQEISPGHHEVVITFIRRALDLAEGKEV